MNEHGYCPNCGKDLDGKLIYQHAIDEGKTHQEALEYAECYGATEHKGKFGIVIGITDPDLDRATKWGCPSCKAEWKQK